MAWHHTVIPPSTFIILQLSKCESFRITVVLEHYVIVAVQVTHQYVCSNKFGLFKVLNPGILKASSSISSTCAPRRLLEAIRFVCISPGP